MPCKKKQRLITVDRILFKNAWTPDRRGGSEKGKSFKKITVAGVGYVGLSLAVLLAQHHEVTAITTTEAKTEKLNRKPLIIRRYDKVYR